MASVIVFVLFTIFLVGAITSLVLVGSAINILANKMTRRAQPPKRKRPVAAPRPEAALPPPEQVWQQARQWFQQVRADYAAYECDPLRVLRLPALADVSTPSTARFVDALAEAQALETDTYPGPAHAPQFVTAVDRAERTWRAARDAAERIRLTGLDPAERNSVERVIKLLTIARESDSEPERLAAYARARAELAKLERAGVVHVPLPAQAALDAAARAQLPAAEP